MPAATACCGCRPAIGEAEVVTAAASGGVWVYGMSRYRSGGGTEPAELVIGFGNVPEHLIRRGVRVLGEVVSRRVA